MNRSLNRFRCPKCDEFSRSYTTIWQEGVVKRVRECTNRKCGHSFNTFESTIDPRAAQQRIAEVKEQLDEFNQTVQSSW